MARAAALPAGQPSAIGQSSPFVVILSNASKTLLMKAERARAGSAWPAAARALVSTSQQSSHFGAAFTVKRIVLPSSSVMTSMS